MANRIILKKGRTIVEEREFISTGSEEISVSDYMYRALKGAGAIFKDFTVKETKKKAKEVVETPPETVVEKGAKNYNSMTVGVLVPEFIKEFNYKPEGLNRTQMIEKLQAKKTNK